MPWAHLHESLKQWKDRIREQWRVGNGAIAEDLASRARRARWVERIQKLAREEVRASDRNEPRKP